MLVEDIEFDLNCMDVFGRLQISDGLEEQLYGHHHFSESEKRIRREQFTAIRYQAEYAAQHHAPLEISIPINDTVSIEFVLIPPGEFMMGSPDDCQHASADEKPQHRVRIQNPYWIAKYPVTQAQYEALIGTNPSHFKNDEDSPERPVECVNWYDSREFCNRLTGLLPPSLKGRKVRLPLEAEWEYACRAGTTTLFPWGDSCDGTQANVDGRYPIPKNSPKGPYLGRTCRVGMYAPNHWGVRDMIGQVWEWCLDRYVADAYKKRAEQGIYVVGAEGEQSSPFVSEAVLGVKTKTSEPPTATTLPLLLELSTISASDPSSEGEQRGRPFVSGEDHGSAMRGSAVPYSATGSMPPLLVPAADSGPPSEGEDGSPFAYEEAGAHSTGIAARTTATLAMTTTCSTTSASDPLSEGEDSDPFELLAEAHGSTTRRLPPIPPRGTGTLPTEASTTSVSDPSSEGEHSGPFDVSEDVHGSTTRVTVVRPATTVIAPTSVATAAAASDQLLEGEDSDPFAYEVVRGSLSEPGSESETGLTMYSDARFGVSAPSSDEADSVPASASDQSSEGEDRDPFERLAEAHGSTTRGNVAQPLSEVSLDEATSGAFVPSSDDPSSFWQDVERTIPANNDGDPVRVVVDWNNLELIEMPRLRGGSWYNYSRNCRSAYCNWSDADYRDGIYGFRPVIVPS